MGDLCFETELTVANIEDEALLGLDVLMKSKWGPVDLTLRDGIMLLGDHVINCTQIGQTDNHVRKVYVAENSEIPPRSEILIDVFVDRKQNDLIEREQNCLLEPSEDFSERYPLVMAPCLVDISKNVTCKARILNPYDYKRTLYQDAIIGSAEIVETKPITLFVCEDNTEIGHQNPTRRLKLLESNPVNWETNEGIIRTLSKKGTSDGGKSGNVPAHLMNMYENIAPGRTETEKQAIANLLESYSEHSPKMKLIWVKKIFSSSVLRLERRYQLNNPKKSPYCICKRRKEIN